MKLLSMHPIVPLIQQGGYALLTLVFIIVGVSALWFMGQASKKDLGISDYQKLEEIKSIILQKTIIGKGSLSESIVDEGSNDYPGTLPCPEDIRPTVIGTDKEGSEKLICHDDSKPENYQGRLAWRTLGLIHNKDSTNAPFWYMVNKNYTQDNGNTQDHKKHTSEFNALPSMFWADDGVTEGEEVVAIIFSPQIKLSEQTRKDNYTSTDLPNINDYIEVYRDTSNANKIVVRRRTQQCLDSAKCVKGVVAKDHLVSNDFVVTISKSEWLEAVQKRIGNTLLYCINRFRANNTLAIPGVVDRTVRQPLTQFTLASTPSFSFPSIGMPNISSLPSTVSTLCYPTPLLTASLPSLYPAECFKNCPVTCNPSYTDMDSSCPSVYKNTELTDSTNHCRFCEFDSKTLPSTHASSQKCSLFVVSKGTQNKNICDNLFGRDINNPHTLNKVNIPDGTWCESVNGSGTCFNKNLVEALDDRGGKGAMLYPYCSDCQPDFWLAQWVPHLFFSYAPDTCKTTPNAGNCLKVETPYGCRFADAVIVFPNEALPSISPNRPNAPLFQRGLTPAKYNDNQTLYTDRIATNPEYFFESYNTTAKSTYRFEQRPKGAIFNDAVFFNDVGQCQ